MPVATRNRRAGIPPMPQRRRRASNCVAAATSGRTIRDAPPRRRRRLPALERRGKKEKKKGGYLAWSLVRRPAGRVNATARTRALCSQPPVATSLRPRSSRVYALRTNRRRALNYVITARRRKRDARTGGREGETRDGGHDPEERARLTITRPNGVPSPSTLTAYAGLIAPGLGLGSSRPKSALDR